MPRMLKSVSAKTASCITLHPLTTQAVRCTIADAEAGTGGTGFSFGGLHFPHGWAGEAADFFPILLHMHGAAEEVRGSFVVVRAGQAIGMAGTKHAPKAGRVEIGYGLVPEVWGRGYATEAVRLLLKHLRGWPDVREVEAETLANNAGSIRVLEKCGFAQVAANGEGKHLLWRLRL